MSDPVADMIAAAKLIRSQTGAKRLFLRMPDGMPERIAELLAYAMQRHKKALRRGLSARYGQRRRQRAQGVAQTRHERRLRARRWIAGRLAGSTPV